MSRHDVGFFVCAKAKSGINIGFFNQTSTPYADLLGAGGMVMMIG